jgi:hypothetical protein
VTGRATAAAPQDREVGEQRQEDRVADDVDRPDGEERDQHRLVDGPPDALGAAPARQPLVAGDDPAHETGERQLDHLVDQVAGRDEGLESLEVAGRRDVALEGHRHAEVRRQRRDPQHEQPEHRRHQHHREHARDDERAHRVDAEHVQRVELVADLACGEVSGHRASGDAGDDHRGDPHGRLATEAEIGAAADPVGGAERLDDPADVDDGEAERERRDRQRRRHERAPDHRIALHQQLAPPRVRRRDDRLEGGDQQVAHLARRAEPLETRHVRQ